MEKQEVTIQSEISKLEKAIEEDEQMRNAEKKRLEGIEHTLKDHKNLLAKKKELI